MVITVITSTVHSQDWY